MFSRFSFNKIKKNTANIFFLFIINSYISYHHHLGRSLHIYLSLSKSLLAPVLVMAKPHKIIRDPELVFGLFGFACFQDVFCFVFVCLLKRIFPAQSIPPTPPNSFQFVCKKFSGSISIIPTLFTFVLSTLQPHIKM